MNQAFRGCYVFGEFRLDGAERRLLRHGTPISLPPKILDTLLLLVENSGHLVEKDEFMRRLWPDTFVGEDALARNISILRKTLGESSDSQSFIATVPTRGYRFVAPVQAVTESELRTREKQPAKERGVLGETAAAKEETWLQGQRQQGATTIGSGVAVSHEPPAPRAWGSLRSWPRRIAVVALVLGAGCVAGLVTFFLLAPAPLPTVTRLTQLTHSGGVDPWPRLVTDGTTIYFLERAGDHWNLMRTSISGGESQIIPTPFKNAVVLDVSPDRANLLMGSFEARQSRMPLWTRPVEGGALKRVADVTAYQAVWHPDGHQILYTEDDGVHIIDADGTNARMFVQTDGQTGGRLSWSPDGKRLRFVSAKDTGVWEWEVSADGKVLQSFLLDSSTMPKYDTAFWSSDGKYFFTNAARTGGRDIWAIREEKTFFHFQRAAPVRLTNGPMSYEGVVPNRDGRRLFAVGLRSGAGGLVKYDPKTQQATPLLQGVCLTAATFSPDGQWLACRSADGTILRMKPDGSERVALVRPSLAFYSQRWSPDGKQVAFIDAVNGRSAVFAVSSEGGAPRQVFPGDFNQIEPGWSADGKFLMFQRSEKSSSPPAIWVLNLATNQLSVLPGSQSMRSPSCSPDGRFVAAQSEDGHKLMLFDVQTSQWTQLAEAKVLNGDSFVWSSDSKCLYFQDLLGNNESLYRFCTGARKPQLAFSFEALLHSGIKRAYFYGFAPNGSLIVTDDRGGADIYALDLDLP